MSALAEALVAVQRKALAAIEKAYVAGKINYEGAMERMDAIGCGDDIDGAQLVSALDVLREFGVAAPAEPKPKPEGDRQVVTAAQLTYMKKLCQERNQPYPPMAETLSRDQASSIIDSLKDGSYDAEAVPF
jgi:hypothetical protein